MNIAIRIVATALLIAASAWIWQEVLPVFGGTMVTEFQYLVPFAAVVIFLTLVNVLTGLAGYES